MTKRLDPESIAAYVDGQLEPEAMAGIAEHLMQDPEALARVRALHGDCALLRAAYQEAAEAPPPPELLAAIDRGFAERAQRSRRAGPSPRFALAAAIALAVVGTLAGYLAGEYRLRSELEVIAARQAEDQRILAAAIERALEHTASGEPVAWQNPDSGSYGQVIPVRTYRSKSDHWCREYLASKVANDIEQKTRAIACRAGDGDWVKVEELYHES
ncbi:RT0821/Lpp0805 family surface protein [Pelagibius marinus]|uniref:RT0821/Lpp0805 family surface protein n=1 Tax=Pelagibius marinus TaxID=2762760 RepID=UPI001873148E|nr:RT0821/Lpp0805 family surface protein [Pelagibius marinus]